MIGIKLQPLPYIKVHNDTLHLRGQWHNGVAEAFVRKSKLSFYHMYKATRFNYAELNSAIKGIINIIIDRPVPVQRTKSDAKYEDFLCPLTQNMLLTGCNARLMILMSLKQPGGTSLKSSTLIP